MNFNKIKKDFIVKKKLIICSILIAWIPYFEFLSHNVHGLDSFSYKFITFTILYLTLALVIFSGIISLLFKQKFLEIFFLLNFITFIFFNYDKIKFLIQLIFVNFGFTFIGEFSLFLLIIFQFLFSIYYYFNKNLKKLNWIIKFSVILFFINFFLFIYLNYNTNIKSYAKQFSNIEYFSKTELKNIATNYKKNKNIYYILMDGATSLEIFDKEIKKIDTEKIFNFYKKNNYTYVKNSKSSYNGTLVSVAHILNLNYHITEASDPFSINSLYPVSMSKFKTSPLGRAIKNIDYDFFWVGNMGYHCKVYNSSLCLPNSRNNKYGFIFNFSNLINSNYALSIFLKKTPIIDITNFISRYIKIKSFEETHDYENDATNKLIKNFELIKNNKKKYFVFVHSRIPHLFDRAEVNDKIYNKNCILSEITDDIRKDISIGYETNYQCALKRINELVTFLNKNDPDGQVIIQGDHGILWMNLKDQITKKQTKLIFNSDKIKKDYNFRSSEIINIIKSSEDCKDFINSEIDNVNAIRFLLSCATNQKPKILKKKTFFSIDFLENSNPFKKKVFNLNTN